MYNIEKYDLRQDIILGDFTESRPKRATLEQKILDLILKEFSEIKNTSEIKPLDYRVLNTPFYQRKVIKTYYKSKENVYESLSCFDCKIVFPDGEPDIQISSDVLSAVLESNFWKRRVVYLNEVKTTITCGKTSFTLTREENKKLTDAYLAFCELKNAAERKETEEKIDKRLEKWKD